MTTPPPTLLACPFCGGEAREAITHLPTGWFDSVECSKCDATVGPYPPPNEAITAWNKRASAAPVTPLASLVERLRDEADLCRNDGADDIAELLDEAATTLEALAAERDALKAVAIQYRDDLRHPPSPDSKDRRLEMIAKLIGKD